MDNLFKTFSLTYHYQSAYIFEMKLPYIGVTLGALDLDTVNTILWKSDNLVSKFENSWKILRQLIKIKPMQVGLSGFL